MGAFAPGQTKTWQMYVWATPDVPLDCDTIGIGFINIVPGSPPDWIGGGGIYLIAGTTDIVTLANNIVAYNRDGVYLSSPGCCTLNQYRNCVYENRGIDSVLRNYVNITNYDTNISSNPVLDTALPWRIQSSSPCRNAGNPSYAPSTDIEGRQRDSSPDIGCYEY